MPFWKRRAKAAEDEEDPMDAPVEQPRGMSAKEARKLASLRKAAQAAARRASRESEKARQAARKVRDASVPPAERRAAATQAAPELPTEMAGQDRPRELAKKDARRLNRLRRRAQRP